jgi:alanyl-tRNA synthetase
VNIKKQSVDSNKVRSLFLEFFQEEGHEIIPSSPMVVKDDPTLMFTNAGMNQFKDIFLEEKDPNYLKVANTQRCLRVSGKHNDLEEVGHDTYHHTMFEMLGNWSFGDYFKEKAISLSWKFLTDICNLDKNRLYVTVFEGSKEDGLSKDKESFDIWKKYLDDESIIYASKKDNFWEMGETGPCGPCSEIHYDNRDNKERKEIEGSLLVNKDHPEVIEIWNLVFLQFRRSIDRKLNKLSNMHVDTGMGFERLCMIMQNKKSNYETDIFQPIIKEIENLSYLKYGNDDDSDIAMRVIADHIRAISFSIADGQLPSNVKAGYVIRRILRRAVRYGYSFLDMKEPFMYNLVDVLDKQMGDYFPEIRSQVGIIKNVIKEEENSFIKTLEAGLKRIQQMINNKMLITGKQLFELYDTFGFPKDLTILILDEKRIKYDIEGFDEEMGKQKNRSKQAAKIKTGDWIIILKDDIQEFVGYEELQVDIKITKYREVTTPKGKSYQLVFNITPFYAEGGGQVGDTGYIENSKERIDIIDTRKENNVTFHATNDIPTDLKDSFRAYVDPIKRISIQRHHTSTHLLHESLREILGEHVQQKGSYVCSDYLRFDFSHFSKVTNIEIRKIEESVNNKIMRNILLDEYKDIPFNKAKEMDPLMLFGEKYGDTVRLIQFDTSKELCGGTHVNSTGEIGLFKIINEMSSASGIRRIEAISGVKVIELMNSQKEIIDELSRMLKTKDLLKSVNDLLLNNKQKANELEDLKLLQLDSTIQALLNKVVKSNGINIIAEKVNLDIGQMKNISFRLKQQDNLLLLLASNNNGKANLTMMITADLLESKGLDASNLINEISKEINGGGGGNLGFATAGGSKISGIDKAFKKLFKILE